MSTSDKSIDPKLLKSAKKEFLKHGFLDAELKTICDDASKMEVQAIMDEFYRLLEADIRKDPGNYLWSHRRWKQVKKLEK